MSNKLMKILMFLTDYASYKTFLDLQNYLYNHKCTNIELDYYYFNYSYANPYKDDKEYLLYTNHQITPYMEHDYTDRKYGYAIQHTIFMESFMSIIKNYTKGQEDLLDINNNSNLYLNNIYWFKEFNAEMNKQKFNNELEHIPRADLYLISSRNGFKCFALLSVEIALSLYLIRKYNSKVFIGGGAINEPDNIIIKLINTIGYEYTYNKLEYLIGTIGIGVYNYINGLPYQNQRSPIERNIINLNITSSEMKYFNNSFAIELVRGCTQGCPYCCNSYINKYDKVDINIYDKWFKYLQEYYPNATIYFYAPEINTDKEYFDEVLEYLINHNIQNPLSFYINITKIDNEQISKLNKLNIDELSCGLDLLFDNVSYKNYGELDELYNKIDTLKQVCNKLIAYIVSNVPNHHLINWIEYKDIYIKYHEVLTYSEFVLYSSTPIDKNPYKYGLDYLYYKNRYNELSAIENIINKVPVMYFRKDINRKELVNRKYDILCNMKKYVLMGATCGFTNGSFLKSLIEQIIPDDNLLDKHDMIIDKAIKRVFLK